MSSTSTPSNILVIGANRPDEPDDFHTVTLGTQNDDSLREDVLELLESVTHFDVVHVDVDVKDNVVILRGTVQSVDTRNFLEDAIRVLPGVVDIINQVYISLDTSA